MRYLVRHASASGTVEEESIEAESKVNAWQMASSAGRSVVAVRRAAGIGRRAALKIDVPWWCRELSTLLRSGMTVVEAIDTLASAGRDDSRGRVVAALQRQLQEGRSLSEAMRSSSQHFPPVLVAGVTASEQTSTLADALDDYLRYHDMIDRLRRQAVSAAIYPTLVMSIGMVIVAFLLVFVMPRFSRLYVEMKGDVSLATRAALWLSSAVVDHAWLLAVGCAGTIAVLVVAARQGRTGMGSLFDRIRPLRLRRDEFRLAKLYQSLAMLFRGGYTLDEALEVGLQLRLGMRLDQAVATARCGIAEGRSPSSAFVSAGLTDAVTARLLAAGERSGSFDAVLQTVSDRHATSFATSIERVMRVAGPLLLLLVALIVGGIVVMMYMPIFDMAGSLGAGR